ncbi:hypothetical protein GCM10009655_26470 [Rhodoglobus aureus]|uniref:DUF6458 domain-containing protein n=2 Tax=Rhodoglobus aureus TaxID=191497 RepID=A0ABP4GMG5_9MICO
MRISPIIGPMSIGTGIVLVVIGAILTFALDLQVAGVNFDLIGYILMIAGAVVFIIGLVLMMRKRTSVTTVHNNDGANGSVSERRTTTTPDETI